MLNDTNIDDCLLKMWAKNVGFGDTQEYLRTTGPTSPLKIKNHRVMIPILVMVERLEGVQPSILLIPRISLPWEWKIRGLTRRV